MGTADRGNWQDSPMPTVTEAILYRTGACWWLWVLVFAVAAFGGAVSMAGAIGILIFALIPGVLS